MFACDTFLYGIGDVENKNKNRIFMMLRCGFCENILPKEAFAFDDELYLGWFYKLPPHIVIKCL
ncbi:hypothetical protein DEM91_01390 [Prevotella sp. TCVGH]|nr:hypothetical protein [Prevotella sp. TCVGH]